jgi:hypothetical protein
MSLSFSTILTAALLGLFLNAGSIAQVYADSALFGTDGASVTAPS